MKILFITAAKGLDYLPDCVFHGLVSLGHVVTDSRYLWYLSGITAEKKRLLYGRGFTIAGLLPDRSNIDRTNLEQRIQNKQFDVIIYGSIHRCSDYLDLVLKTYPRNRVVVLDGQDLPIHSGTNILTNLLDKCIYFKRELNDSRALPISFSFPEQKIIQTIPGKQKFQAFIVPGKKSTYIYKQQPQYYHDYAISNFGLTRLKNGWDCMRHYQIIGNHCLPYFMNFQACPRYTMVNWPTELQLQANNMYQTKNLDKYQQVLQEFFSYCKQNLTTKKSAQYVLSKVF